MIRVSFLIPVHNEEKIIRWTLDHIRDNFAKYDWVEVIVGDDGSNDKTPEIVKKYNFVKYVRLENRGGKPEVLKSLLPIAKGDIVIINDADWRFVYNGDRFENMLKGFDSNPKLGGIADSFSGVYTEERVKRNDSLGFLADAWTSQFRIELQKKIQTKKINDYLYVDFDKMNFPFFVNIFRKDIIDESTTLGDDIERTLQILSKGYLIKVLQDEREPHVLILEQNTTLKDMFKQKVRTHFARKQIKEIYNYNPSFFKFYIPYFFYSFFNLYRIKRFKSLTALFCFWWVMIFSYIKSSEMHTNKVSTKQAWQMRLSR